jgi:parvulin-like peptidyl-prolyl isomerase
MIDHDILARAAELEKVAVTPGDVTATRDRIAAQIGGDAGLTAEALKAGIAAKDLDQTLADVALRDALGDKLTADVPVPDTELALAYQRNIKDYDQVHSAHILVASKPQALALLAQVKAHPDQFAALAAKYSIDAGSKTIGGDLGFQGRGALEKNFETAIFTHRAGSFVLAQTQYGFHVIHVMEHHVTTLAQAKPTLRRGLLGQQRSDAVQALLLKTATDLDIKVNPRFGTWNAKTLEVLAPQTSTDSPVSPSPRPGDATPTPVAPAGP